MKILSMRRNECSQLTSPREVLQGIELEEILGSLNQDALDCVMLKEFLRL